MANWEAFVQQVAGGIQRGASGWAGTIRSDVERKKDMKDRLAILEKEKEYADQKQAADHKWDRDRMDIASDLAKKNAEFDSQLRQREAKDMAQYAAKMEALMGDPQLGQQWALMQLMGQGPVAQAQYDLLNRIKAGDVPGPKDGAVLAGFPAISLGELKKAIKGNQDRLLERQSKEAYIGYFTEYQKQLSGKEEWTLPKTIDMYEDATMKLVQIQKDIGTLENDIGFQSVMQTVSKFKTEEQLMASPEYGRYVTYQQQRNNLRELMRVQYGIQQAIKSRMDDLNKLGPAPEEPTAEDKKAAATAEDVVGYVRGTTPRMSKAREPRQESFWESAQPARAGQLVTQKLGDVATQLAHGLAKAGGFEESPTPEKIAYAFNLGPNDVGRIHIVKTPADYRAIASGAVSLAEGTLIYDTHKKDLMRVFVSPEGELSLLEVQRRKKR